LPRKLKEEKPEKWLLNSKKLCCVYKEIKSNLDKITRPGRYFSTLLAWLGSL